MTVDAQRPSSHALYPHFDRVGSRGSRPRAWFLKPTVSGCAPPNTRRVSVPRPRASPAANYRAWRRVFVERLRVASHLERGLIIPRTRRATGMSCAQRLGFHVALRRSGTSRSCACTRVVFLRRGSEIRVYVSPQAGALRPSELSYVFARLLCTRRDCLLVRQCAVNSQFGLSYGQRFRVALCTDNRSQVSCHVEPSPFPAAPIRLPTSPPSAQDTTPW